MIGGIITAVIIAAVITLVARSGGTAYEDLVRSGRPAQGILLVVNPRRQRVSTFPAVERRRMTIDIEVGGEQPYTTTADVAYASNLSRDILPGATMELRVHARDRSSIAIVGPSVGLAGTLTP